MTPVPFTFRVEQAWNTQLSFCQDKRLLQIVSVGPIPNTLHVNQLGAQREDDGVERDTRTPAGSEIFHVQSHSSAIIKIPV